MTIGIVSSSIEYKGAKTTTYLLSSDLANEKVMSYSEEERSSATN